MATQVTAIWTEGILKPDQPVPLPDQTRVRLTVEPLDEWSPEKALAALQSIQARLKERPIDSGGVKYTRDELHERR